MQQASDAGPIEGKPVRFPPGKLAIHLHAGHQMAYRRLYARYQSILGGLPVLRERDFDGRTVKVSPAELDALNKAFAAIGDPAGESGTAFSNQESSRTRLFKRLQYLS